jgi:hypothetical protein
MSACAPVQPAAAGGPGSIVANATHSFPFSATPTMRAPSPRSHNPLPLRQDRVEDLRGVYKTFGLEEAARVKVRQS